MHLFQRINIALLKTKTVCDQFGIYKIAAEGKQFIKQRSVSKKKLTKQGDYYETFYSMCIAACGFRCEQPPPSAIRSSQARVGLAVGGAKEQIARRQVGVAVSWIPSI